MSFQHSSRIIGPLLHWLFPQLPAATVHAVVVAVRKTAHVTEYAVLVLLLLRALRAREVPQSRAWSWPQASRALLLVILYAASDEFHQAFVPSREASVADVLIDTSGAALGLIILWLLKGVRLFRRIV